MRLPIIKHIDNFVEENDSDYIQETIDVLEHISEARGIKDDELDVLGELISNLYGAIEVRKLINEGKTQREALNEFMQRVTGSIDQ